MASQVTYFYLLKYATGYGLKEAARQFFLKLHSLQAGLGSQTCEAFTKQSPRPGRSVRVSNLGNLPSVRAYIYPSSFLQHRYLISPHLKPCPPCLLLLTLHQRWGHCSLGSYLLQCAYNIPTDMQWHLHLSIRFLGITSLQTIYYVWSLFLLLVPSAKAVCSTKNTRKIGCFSRLWYALNNAIRLDLLKPLTVTRWPFFGTYLLVNAELPLIHQLGFSIPPR
jgi:hypothetical protein